MRWRSTPDRPRRSGPGSSWQGTAGTGSCGHRGAGEEMPTCPAGHPSASSDFCDVCGIRIGVSASILARPPAVPPREPQPQVPAAPCPRCDTARSGRFCESCGFDFDAGEAPAAAPAARAAPGGDGGGSVEGPLRGGICPVRQASLIPPRRSLRGPSSDRPTSLCAGPASKRYCRVNETRRDGSGVSAPSLAMPAVPAPAGGPRRSTPTRLRQLLITLFAAAVVFWLTATILQRGLQAVTESTRDTASPAYLDAVQARAELSDADRAAWQSFRSGAAQLTGPGQHAGR